MVKEKNKTKEKKSKKKSKTDHNVSESVVPPTSTPPVEEKRILNKKTSLLPNSISKPLEDLKRRVEVLEGVIAKILSLLEK